MSGAIVNWLVAASLCFIGYSIFNYVMASIREYRRLNRLIAAEEIRWKWQEESRSDINRMLREIERVKK